jgi:chromosome partitioning protein
MPTFITLAHQKGGVSKTTLSFNLYAYFERAGLRVILVDSDPQGSITKLCQIYGTKLENYNLIKRTDYKGSTDLVEKTKDYDIVIIDTPPYNTGELRNILKLTNFLILPCKPSLADALAIQDTINIAKEEQGKNIFKCGIVITQKIAGSNIHLETIDMLELNGLYIFDQGIVNRVSYIRALNDSGNVFTGNDISAKKEIESFAKEMLDLISKS